MSDTDGIEVTLASYANLRAPAYYARIELCGKPVDGGECVLGLGHSMACSIELIKEDDLAAVTECVGEYSECTCGGCACSMCGSNAMTCDGQCSSPDAWNQPHDFEVEE